MLDIYVCEDNKIQLELISKYVSNTILSPEEDEPRWYVPRLTLD